MCDLTSLLNKRCLVYRIEHVFILEQTTSCVIKKTSKLAAMVLSHWIKGMKSVI